MAHFSSPPSSRKETATRMRSHSPSRRARRSTMRYRMPTRVLKRGIPLLVALVVVLVAGIWFLRLGSSPTTTSNSVHQTANTGNTSTIHTQEATDFTLSTLGGGTFHLAAQHGHPVVLYFMATTCASCVQGSQQLAQDMQTANVAGAKALAIDVNPGDGSADLHTFIQSVGQPAAKTLQWGIDGNGAVATAYGVQTLETMVVIDAQGKIIANSGSPIPAAQLAQLVRSAA